MDLSCCPTNQQVPMEYMEKVLAKLMNLSMSEELKCEYTVSGTQNLAFENIICIQLVTYGSGVVMKALKKCVISDLNNKTCGRSARALTNLVCNETAEVKL